MKKILFLITIISFFGTSFAQQKLSFDDAVRIVLKNNYGIRISFAEKKITENNLSLGNAGFLPVVTADANLTNNSFTQKQDFTNGTSVKSNGLTSSNLTAGVTLSWTLFDGFEMFVDYNRLKELNKTGELYLKSDIQNAVFDLMNTYFGIIKEQQTIKVIKNTILLSQERVRITQDKKNVGSSSKFEVLQAQSDLNQDSSSLLNEELKLTQLFNKLNRLLGEEPGIVYSVDESIPVNSNLNYSELLENLKKNNTEILLAEQNFNLAKLNTDLAKTDYYPVVSAFAGYNFTGNKPATGLIEKTNTYGFNYGIKASVNLFDGLNTSRSIENALINENILQLQLEDIKSGILNSFENAYKKYLNNLSLVELEKHNLQISAENVEIALERLKLGNLTPFEFRQVQITQLNAETRLLNAIYETKLAEAELLRITGSMQVL